MTAGVILMMAAVCAGAQDYPVQPERSDENSFSMVVLPDPQSYIKYAANQPLFELQTAWVINSMERLDTRCVLCTGDLVEQNDILTAENGYTDQTGIQQWEAVSQAFERLDNNILYVNCTGNHDYGYVSAENRNSHFPEYFTPERSSCFRSALVATGLNAHGVPSLENAAYEIETGTWGKILVLSLEFDPRPEALEWAVKTANDGKYKDHTVILLTHSYMDKDARRYTSESYRVSPASYGEDIWRELVYPSKNIRLVVCGHECDIVDYDKQVSFRTDLNSSGKSVAQMMFNAQTADGKWEGNGGDCWVRILEFMPDGKTIKVRTFSPLFALSPLTADKAWRTAPYDQFEIVLEK